MTAKNTTPPTESAPKGLALTDADRAAARHEGATEAVKEDATATYNFLTDGQLPGAPPKRQWLGSEDIGQYADVLDLGLPEFEARLADEGPRELPEDKVAGLLKLERAGRNRTPFVQALVKRLGVKSVYEVTDAGPPYTNDLSSVTSL